MKQYVVYLSYLVRHKWYVTIECFKRGLIWRGLKHDYDKFYPAMISAYANFFYNKDGSKKQIRNETGYYKPTDTGNIDFDKNWFKHTRRNDHHWQYFVLATDNGEEKLVDMPPNAVLEMVCDWIGAGKAQGTPDTLKWWEVNKSKMRFSTRTLSLIQDYLEVYLENK